jgi:hypothetical protein
MVAGDDIFQSIQPEIEEKVAAWVEEAVRAGCRYVSGSGTGNAGLILFKNYEGKRLQKRLNFRVIYQKAGYLRVPCAEIADYALLRIMH